MKKNKKEVEYKEKAGTAWSHSYLNQKPWHPLSYPNQRRKWIAEQTHAQKEDRRAEVAREFAQEQEFFRQTAQMSKKEKEKMEVMQAVSFMYMRPPGYNAEAARAAEIADERKRLGLTSTLDVDVTAKDGDASTGLPGKKNPRVKDVFGRTLPTEEEFPSLRNAPRHDTGAPTRVKPFAIEIRNVKCARCGAFGHQSGDRECPLKDVLMPSEEARLTREDPLNTILAQTSADERFAWELKQKPGGLSPARGGFKPDDPNQQIIPDEDIYDEYGGFLQGGGDDGSMSIPNLLTSLSYEQRKELTDVNAQKKHKRKKRRKLKRTDNRPDITISDNSVHHKLDRHQEDRKSSSSEGGQRYERCRKGETDSSMDDGKDHLYRDYGKSDYGGDDQESLRSKGGRKYNIHISNQKIHGSEGRKTSGTSDKKSIQRPKLIKKFCASDDQITRARFSKDRLDIREKHHKGTKRRSAHLNGDTRMDSDDEPNRLWRKNGERDSSDDDLGLRPEDKRDNSDAELRISRQRLRGRDSNDYVERSLSLKERRGHGDDEHGRLRYEERSNSTDHERRKLTYKDRRDSSDDEQRRVLHEDSTDSCDDEHMRLRRKNKKDNSDDDQRRLRHNYSRDNTGKKPRRWKMH